ncbi:hypothetical protein [Pedobacter sp. MC2016-24]|uniref:hypothetical protein n=1 Tax=Pedobacter sp. MC2016-24 TaxID=2780090 RepID=UPI00188000E3|nr:hypothetical protein [Pedobacter sp. MC2016-24]MBE9601884.1 hypothetical protein [Pedobacter sp. MC2016-24]
MKLFKTSACKWLNVLIAGNMLLFVPSSDLLAQHKEIKDTRYAQVQLPGQENNRMKTAWPSVACWFWMDEEFAPEGYKRFIDLYEKHSHVGLITASIRFPGELTDPAVHQQIKKAAEYSHRKGMGLIMDLDVRLAREKFKSTYPDELQEILLLKEIQLKENESTGISVKSPAFDDHYTYGRNPYAPLNSKLLRVYAYEKENGLIKSGTVTDITGNSTASGDQHELKISIDLQGKRLTACVLVAVTIHTPDVFAPHLLSYQREILHQYADTKLAGAAKDEWGFPGRIAPPSNELWYSAAMAKVYQKRRPGHDLLKDMLLMAWGEQGKETERSVAINHYMEMNFLRNAEIETDYYQAIKETFGATAVSATHPTWFPYPDSSEVFKNGLSWWRAKRDLAQTDEATPYSVRTALTKKWQSPLWYNMFYSAELATYSKDLWVAVLGGGRLNYHPPFPTPMKIIDSSIDLLKGRLMTAESRIQMLNYISASPVDCRVAVVFGHPSALNWSTKKGFADAGVKVTDQLWKSGYYADLIPSSEIVNGALKIGVNGKIQYGPQQYDAVLYYGPENDHSSVASFFRKAAAATKTALFRTGRQTMDFNGNKVDDGKYFPKSMQYGDENNSVNRIISLLKAKNTPIQTPAVMRGMGAFAPSMMPQTHGMVKLIDGTVIIASGEKEVTGDPIQMSIQIHGKKVNIDAIGIAGIRLNKSGLPEALAFGGLKSFSTGTFELELPERMDIALVKENGLWKGIMQGSSATIPESLLRITKNWTYIPAVASLVVN